MQSNHAQTASHEPKPTMIDQALKPSRETLDEIITVLTEMPHHEANIEAAHTLALENHRQQMTELRRALCERERLIEKSISNYFDSVRRKQEDLRWRLTLQSSLIKEHYDALLRVPPDPNSLRNPTTKRHLARMVAATKRTQRTLREWPRFHDYSHTVVQTRLQAETNALCGVLMKPPDLVIQTAYECSEEHGSHADQDESVESVQESSHVSADEEDSQRHVDEHSHTVDEIQNHGAESKENEQQLKQHRNIESDQLNHGTSATTEIADWTWDVKRIGSGIKLGEDNLTAYNSSWFGTGFVIGTAEYGSGTRFSYDIQIKSLSGAVAVGFISTQTSAWDCVHAYAWHSDGILFDGTGVGYGTPCPDCSFLSSDVLTVEVDLAEGSACLRNYRTKNVVSIVFDSVIQQQKLYGMMFAPFVDIGPGSSVVLLCRREWRS